AQWGRFIDGKITAGGAQRPGSPGSPFDRSTMNVIRGHFDAVLAGGNTIRQHPYYLGVPCELENARKQKGLASQPLTVVLTRSGRLDPVSPLFTRAPRLPVVITSPAGAQRMAPSVKAKANIEILQNSTPHQIITLLRQKYQVRRLLVEGGPSVNYQFMHARLLDELFLTLHPSLIGNRTDLNLAAGDGVLERAERIALVSINQHNNELFLRYRIAW
ncbi:MAG TPA: hypothetical protein DDW87_09755, partial [Firmicutes bacterium]|nr:hypothetical protein [Bacillota bacterium]